MRPIIGITPSLEGLLIQVSRKNSDAILATGGTPVILPYLTDAASIGEIASFIDGLLLSGGGDINPFWFGEEPIPELGSIIPERDEFEIMLIREMLERNKPILAICRGCQIVNIAAGGNMYQDIYVQKKGNLLQHVQKAPRDHGSHFVYLWENSPLAQIFGQHKVKVNSFHHQAVKDLAPGFVVSGTSSDGVIEAFHSQDHSFVIGVQWHPEDLFPNDSLSRLLFQAFVNASK